MRSGPCAVVHVRWTIRRRLAVVHSSCLFIYLFGGGGDGFVVGFGCGGLFPLPPPEGFPVVLGALVGLCLLMILEFNIYKTLKPKTYGANTLLSAIL